MKSELAKDIVRVEGKIRYDAQCKKVFANKTILHEKGRLNSRHSGSGVGL